MEIEKIVACIDPDNSQHEKVLSMLGKAKIDYYIIPCDESHPAILYQGSVLIEGLNHIDEFIQKYNRKI